MLFLGKSQGDTSQVQTAYHFQGQNIETEWEESEYFEKAIGIRLSNPSKMENSLTYTACLLLLEVFTDFKQVKYKIMMLNSLEGLQAH